LLTFLESEEIQGRNLTDDERDTFSLIADFNLKVRFSADERRTIRDFLTAES